MKFNIIYEDSSGASEKFVASITDYLKIEYDQLLQGRKMSNLFLKDTDTNMWIRIPSIKVLRCLLSAVSDEVAAVSIIFSELDVSPNQSRQSSPGSGENPDEIDDFFHRVSRMRFDFKDESTLGGRSAANSLGPFTMNDVSDILAQELLILPDDDDPEMTIRIHAPSLLVYIRSEVFDGTHIYDITVQAQSERKMLKITLKKNIWTTYLLRVNGCSGIFLDFMASSLGNVTMLDRSLLELHQKSILLNKVKVFHNDLKTFGQSAEAQKRLDADPMAFCFMSSVYFTEIELEYLYSFPTSSGLTCKEYLCALIESKIGSGIKNATLCTSHDLATAFAKIYGIRKEYSKDTQFKKFLKDFGKVRKA